MAAIDDDFHAAGAEIIWILEESATFSGGTADNCLDVMTTLGADQGWCVGDDETDPPFADVWDDSPLAEGRGVDLIVRRSTMTIEWVASHGSPSGNDNVAAEDILAEVEALVAGN